MSPTIGLPPPPAERCLETSRKSRYRGGTLVAEDVHDLDEHRRRLADPDRYRPVSCGQCGGAALHVHTRPERRPRGEPSLPPAVTILQFRCAECGATWRILPLFLARHPWHAWKAVERAVASSPSPALASSSARDTFVELLDVIDAVYPAGRGHIIMDNLSSQDDLAAKVDAYVEWYLRTDRPFHWSYRPKSWRMDGRTSAERN